MAVSVEQLFRCDARGSLIQSLQQTGLKIIMGHRQVEQAALLNEFSGDKHIPADHLLRSIDRFVELGDLRRGLAAFYSTLGRPSVDPEVMIRMLSHLPRRLRPKCRDYGQSFCQPAVG